MPPAQNFRLDLNDPFVFWAIQITHKFFSDLTEAINGLFLSANVSDSIRGHINVHGSNL